MWCDEFDADLLNVVPGAAEALDYMADTGLLTYSRPTAGKINCPSSWNTYQGSMAFFWTAPEFQPGPYWHTDAPVTPCTFLEALRDEWVHGSLVNVNGTVVWEPPQDFFMALMFDLRGITPLSAAGRSAIQDEVTGSLVAAASFWSSPSSSSWSR